MLTTLLTSMLKTVSAVGPRNKMQEQNNQRIQIQNQDEKEPI